MCPKERALTTLDLRLFLTSVLGEEPWKYDPKVVPLPWRQSEEDATKSKISSGLTLGYYSCDGVVCAYRAHFLNYAHLCLLN